MLAESEGCGCGDLRPPRATTAAWTRPPSAPEPCATTLPSSSHKPAQTQALLLLCPQRPWLHQPRQGGKPGHLALSHTHPGQPSRVLQSSPAGLAGLSLPHLLVLQQDEPHYGDVDGVPDAGVVEQPGHLQGDSHGDRAGDTEQPGHCCCHTSCRRRCCRLWGTPWEFPTRETRTGRGPG